MLLALPANKQYILKYFTSTSAENVVAQWHNPLTLQPEQSGTVGSILGRAPSFECHEKGS